MPLPVIMQKNTYNRKNGNITIISPNAKIDMKSLPTKAKTKEIPLKRFNGVFPSSEYLAEASDVFLQLHPICL
jgi:hypothetical protein